MTLSVMMKCALLYLLNYGGSAWRTVHLPGGGNTFRALERRGLVYGKRMGGFPPGWLHISLTPKGHATAGGLLSLRRLGKETVACKCGRGLLIGEPCFEPICPTCALYHRLCDCEPEGS